MFPWETEVDGELSGAPGKMDDPVLCLFRLLLVLSEVRAALLLVVLRFRCCAINWWYCHLPVELFNEE